MTVPRQPPPEDQLTLAEVEVVLRRAAELGARRRSSDSDAQSISPEVLVQVAAAIGIPEHDVRRALFDLFSDRTVEPYTLGRRLYGNARLKAVREVERPVESIRDHLEDLLKSEQGLKLRRKTEASSLYDAGDLFGTMRRALDFSGHRALSKARSVELRVEDAGYGRSATSLAADITNQRGEYLSFGGILGATLAIPLAIAGVQYWPYFLAVLPALVAPFFGFKLAYQRVRTDLRRAMDGLLDAAEQGPLTQKEGPPEEEPSERTPGQIRSLKPIPRFTLRRPKE